MKKTIMITVLMIFLLFSLVSAEQEQEEEIELFNENTVFNAIAIIIVALFIWMFIHKRNKELITKNPRRKKRK